MLHISLRNKIQHPELRLLYDSKMAMSNPVMRSELTGAIQKLRQKFNTRTRVDPVEHRLEVYGNEGGWYVAKVKELVKQLYQAKGVGNDFVGQWRSIEFELIFKSKKDVEDFAILARQHGLGKFLTIKTDGSLRTEREGEVAQEIAFSYMSGNEQQVRELCRLLKGRAYVNKTCGTHVHFDFRHVGGEEATLYGKRLARCVPALKLLLPAARRESEYCKQIINNIAQAAGAGSHGRYAFVNMHAYSKYKSIEIRGHSGTINADKILNWIKLCEIIMATDLNFTGKPEHRNEVHKVADLLSQYADKFNGDMVAYINDRATKFSVATTDEAENVVLEQEVATMPMFSPTPKKKPAPKKAKKKREQNGAVPAGVVIPPAVQAPVAPNP